MIYNERMYKINIFEGEQYGYLTVIARAENAKNGHSRWVCKCRCGKETVVLSTHLKSGRIKSCGCWWQERKHEYRKIHGFTKKERLYNIWQAMKNRCYTKSHWQYQNYGGRGIVVCEEWKSNYLNFRNWALENGYEDNLTIDRIDVNGNYEPNNCRWATMAEQNLNKRNSHLITYKGITKTMTEWAWEVGLPPCVVQYRLNKAKWSVEKALPEPIKENGGIYARKN